MSLTDKASLILNLATQGKTDKEIAQELGLQPSAVDWHWRRIRKTLGASNRTEAVAKGLRFVHERDRGSMEVELAAARDALGEARRRIVDLESAAELAGEQVHTELKRAYTEVSQLRLAGLDPDDVVAILGQLNIIFYRYEGRPPFRCLEVSPSIDQLGYTQDEMLTGKTTIFDIVHGDDYVPLLEDWNRAMEVGFRYLVLAYRYARKDGSLVWTLARCTRSPNRPNEFVKVALLDEEGAIWGRKNPRPGIIVSQ